MENNWTVIYFNDQSLDEIRYELYRLSIISFRKFFPMCQIVIIMDDCDQSKLYSVCLELNADLIVNEKYSGTTIFDVVKKYLDNGENIILVQNNIILTSTINLLDCICARIKVVSEFSENYLPISLSLGKKYFVDSSLLIIPYNTKNHSFINTCYENALKIKSNDSIFVSNIVLTLLNDKYQSFIDSDNSVFLNFYEIKDNLSLSAVLLEMKLLYGMIDWNLILDHFNPIQFPQYVIPNTIMEYDSKEYLYYPLMDFCTDRKLITYPCAIFNTNGFAPIAENTIYDKMFPRFSNKWNGLFIKKDYNSHPNCNHRFDMPIPLIVHHLWLNSEPSTNYINNWKRLIKSPWIYKVWTYADLRMDVFSNPNHVPNRWRVLYDSEKDCTKKIVIASMAILEKYGGIMIEGFCLPVKSFPLNLLNNNFFTAFVDDFTTNLNYRIMASIPNNLIIETIYAELISNKPFSVESILKTNPDVIIYPSYYFNPATNLPKVLLKSTILIFLWEQIFSLPIESHTGMCEFDDIITDIRIDPGERKI
jgi:hypothetical protein